MCQLVDVHQTWSWNVCMFLYRSFAGGRRDYESCFCWRGIRGVQAACVKFQMIDPPVLRALQVSVICAMGEECAVATKVLAIK